MTGRNAGTVDRRIYGDHEQQGFGKLLHYRSVVSSVRATTSRVVPAVWFTVAERERGRLRTHPSPSDLTYLTIREIRMLTRGDPKGNPNCFGLVNRVRSAYRKGLIYKHAFQTKHFSQIVGRNVCLLASETS